ncbi:hypothetical protein JQ543_32950 [Bradyrhizobium diazoefficiens]|nr:hypothetical protein [Bradyrhizobium diazoefficiens]MBR0779614.1 hypothetical protein [Bradyrhizobium diazoefficiens]MBR0852579.1 hypothetical protein [Bradyrhizobium diazoefficiens]
MAELVKGILDLRLGKRIVGRRGRSSRIKWYFLLPSIAEVARGQADKLQEVGGSDLDDELVDYAFKLRDDKPPVTMRLFSDLTEREVERLYLFQKSLVK